MRDVTLRLVTWSPIRRCAGVVGTMALVIALTAALAFAQSFDVLATFGSPEGMQPYSGLVQGLDGGYYGTTIAGGNGYGTVLRVDGSGIVTTLAMFNKTNGQRPEGGVVQGFDGNLYGVTRQGGTYNVGVVFMLNMSTRTITVLRSFSTTDGAEPIGSLVQGDDGYLYGTTSRGGLTCGTSTCGTVFRIGPSGAFTTLLKFNSTNGAVPMGALLKGADGRFYGTTSQGGANNRGTVFVISSTGAFQTLYSFSSTGAEGYSPYGALIQASDGLLYGTAYLGGALGKGSIFRLTTSGGLTSIHSFAGTTDGSNPRAGLVKGSDGRLYGLASMGGLNGKGTIFSTDTSGATIVLRSLATTDGVNPLGPLVLASSGMFYGTASSSGPAGSAGTIFKISSTGSFSVMHAFLGSPAKPYASFVQGRDGRLYGTSYSGGGYNKGTIFAIGMDGSVQLIHGFTGTDGGNPMGSVVQDASSNWFGATSTGGSAGRGTGFKMSGAGAMQAVVSLASPGGYSAYTGLVMASDGNYYGGASVGGAYGYGTLFRLAPTGTLTHIYSFTGPSGSSPYAAMIVGPNGLLYGTTPSGGTSGLGTVFSFDPVTARLTSLASFNGTNGSAPRGSLVLANDGYLYGTTVNGGASNLGTIFRISPYGGAIQTVFSFAATIGTNPYGSPIQAADGMIYGTTYTGGSYRLGTVFQFNPATGALKTIINFTGANGSYPKGGVVQASDGNLYGATTAGGSAGNGVVYRIALY